MSFLSSLLTWANAPFTVVLGITVVFALLQVTGVLGVLAGGGEHDADVDADADADLDGDGVPDHDVDADADGDADGDHDNDAHAGGSLLAAFGVGRVPFSILWQSFALSFALAGIAANTVFVSRAGAVPTGTLLWTLPLALCVGLLCTRGVARVLGPVLSNPQANATSRRELVGQAGVVISSRVGAEFGEVRIKDKTGHVVRVICRTRDGEPEVPEGREIVVVDYDAERDRIYVAPLDPVAVRIEAREAEARAEGEAAPVAAASGTTRRGGGV